MLKKLWQWIEKLYRQWFWRSKNWLNYADKKRQIGQWKEAISAYDHVIQLEPGNYLAWRKKAYTFSEIGQDEEALSCYEKTVRIKRDDYEVWCEKASVLERLERYQEAINAYGNALQIKSDLLEAWEFQGDLFVKIQQEETAVQCYEQALFFKPENEKLKQKKDTLVEKINEEKKLKKLMDEVEELYNNNKFQESVEIYEQILAKKDNYFLGWYHYGYSLLQLGQYDQALNSLDKALKIQEENAELWYFKGKTLENLGNFEEALISYEEAIKLNGRYYQALDGKAIALMKLNKEENKEENEEEAFNSWEKAFEINPNYFQGWLNRGLILISKDQYNEALENFDKAIEINNDYYHAWLVKARLDADFGRYQEALKIWNKLFADFNNKKEQNIYLENRALISINLADELLNYAIKIYKTLLDKITIYSQQKREIVNELLDKTLILDPTSPKAWWYKGKGIKYSFDLSRLERDKTRLNCYFKALLYFNKNDKDYDELYQEHLFVKNHFASDLNADAQEHIKAGEFQEAIEELSESITIFEDLKEHKDIINSYRLRGHLYSQLGQYQDAINDFNKALLFESDSHYLTYAERGTSYQLLGDFQKAIDDYSLALEIKPTFECYNSRGLLYIEQKQYSLAIDDFTEAINLKPSEANCFYSRAFAKAQLSQIQAAIDDFLQAAELYKVDDNIDAYKVAITAVENLQENQ